MMDVSAITVSILICLSTSSEHVKSSRDEKTDSCESLTRQPEFIWGSAERYKLLFIVFVDKSQAGIKDLLVSCLFVLNRIKF